MAKKLWDVLLVSKWAHFSERERDRLPHSRLTMRSSALYRTAGLCASTDAFDPKLSNNKNDCELSLSLLELDPNFWWRSKNRARNRKRFGCTHPKLSSVWIPLLNMRKQKTASLQMLESKSIDGLAETVHLYETVSLSRQALSRRGQWQLNFLRSSQSMFYWGGRFRHSNGIALIASLYIWLDQIAQLVNLLLDESHKSFIAKLL